MSTFSFSLSLTWTHTCYSLYLLSFSLSLPPSILKGYSKSRTVTSGSRSSGNSKSPLLIGILFCVFYSQRSKQLALSLSTFTLFSLSLFSPFLLLSPLCFLLIERLTCFGALYTVACVICCIPSTWQTER